MAWGRMGPKMKPGQLFHLGTMKQRLLENYERENEFVRTRKLPVTLVDAGIPARMPHPTDTRLDETLGIPLAIADQARRQSAACLEYVGSFYAGILPTTRTPENETPAPTTMPVRRMTTISIAREEQVEAEAAMDEDDEVFNNVFCTTPLKTSPTRPQFSSSKRSKARSVILTDPQLDEVWNRRVGPGIRVVPKTQTKTKTRSLTRSMRTLSCTDNTTGLSFGRSEVRSLKRKRSSGGPSTSTPVKPMSPAPVTPGAWMETTAPAAAFDMPGTCSAQRKKAPATALKIVKSRKRMKLTHNMTEMELEKMSGTRRRLFEDVHIIHPTCRYS